VIANVAGLLTAVLWSGTTLASARASRAIGSPSTLALVMLTGLLVTAPFVVTEPIPTTVTDPRSILLLATAGLGNVVGLLLLYRAFHTGLVAVVSAIASTEGSIAALIAIVAGEAIAPGIGIGLAVVAIGIVVVGGSGADRTAPVDVFGPDPDVVDRPTVEPVAAPYGTGRLNQALLLAIGAAIAFGVALYALGRVSIELPVVWAVLPARLAGVLVVAVPLIATRRLIVTRDALPFAVASGLLEVAGVIAYGVGARDSLSITPVLASLFVPLSAIVAYFLFSERLTRPQVVGIVTVVLGVALVGAIRAS
jgi:drug/metabolite transporter (DMT)-like permease